MRTIPVMGPPNAQAKLQSTSHNASAASISNGALSASAIVEVVEKPFCMKESCCPALAWQSLVVVASTIGVLVPPELRDLMARYKYIDTNPRFLPVDLARQLLPGTFEHA
ncbi:MAG: hypothetical protein LH467_14100, partial [Gemmatimonadaceae bacterium]|nr:hypothetical protein [Gemmatimonadaceae bacterium]